MTLFYPPYAIITTLIMLIRIISFIAAIAFIVTIATVIILYGRGYRFDFEQKSINSTGILSVSSYPDKASIILDGKLTSVTNNSLTIPPGWYQVKVTKEGYQAWENKVRVQGEIVTQLDVLLIPTDPSLKALTVSGIQYPSLSHTKSKIAYVIPPDDSVIVTQKPKNGIWVLDLRSGLFGGRAEPKQEYIYSLPKDTNVKIHWSPDEKQLIVAIYRPTGKKDVLLNAFLLTIDDSNNGAIEISTRLPQALTQWKTEIDEREKVQISLLHSQLTSLLTTSAKNLSFSPDDGKILYLATKSATLAPIITPPLIGSNSTEQERTVSPAKYYIYDIKEDKNYFIIDEKDVLLPNSLAWYTDSKHLVLIEKESINIIDYDGKNKRTVYTGPFRSDIVFPWPQGGMLVILANLNNPQSNPNLYEIDLR